MACLLHHEQFVIVSKQSSIMIVIKRVQLRLFSVNSVTQHQADFTQLDCESVEINLMNGFGGVFVNKRHGDSTNAIHFAFVAGDQRICAFIASEFLP